MVVVVIVCAGWVLLAVLSGLALARIMRLADQQDPAGSWAEFCVAHGLDEMVVPFDPARP